MLHDLHGLNLLVLCFRLVLPSITKLRNLSLNHLYWTMFLIYKSISQSIIDMTLSASSLECFPRS